MVRRLVLFLTALILLSAYVPQVIAQTYRDADRVRYYEKKRQKKKWKRVGIGALGGTAIGALVGGGKGAAIGAAAGAGGGYAYHKSKKPRDRNRYLYRKR